MRSVLSVATLLTLLSGLPSDAHAQALSFEIKSGLVTLDAQNVSVWEILQRWAAVGGVTFVDADQIPRTPVSLSLTGEPEIRALEILLRGVSGYIVGRREPSDSAPPSSIDRVLIVANSVAPRIATPVTSSERRAGIAFVQQGPPAPDDVSFGAGPVDVDLVNPQSNANDFGNRNVVGAPATRPAVATGSAGRAFSQGPAVSASQQQAPVSAVTGPSAGIVDDNGIPVRGPTPIPAEPGEDTAKTSPDTSAPNPIGVTGASRPGTVTPVPRPQP